MFVIINLLLLLINEKRGHLKLFYMSEAWTFYISCRRQSIRVPNPRPVFARNAVNKLLDYRCRIKYFPSKASRVSLTSKTTNKITLYVIQNGKVINKHRIENVRNNKLKRIYLINEILYVSLENLHCLINNNRMIPINSVLVTLCRYMYCSQLWYCWLFERSFVI